MKWKKLGQIFDFDTSVFAKDYVSHAQSPQAVVFEDFVRIYFSTRRKDESDKFVTHVQYVDYDKSFETMLGHSAGEVLAKGQLGCFDEHGIFPISPVRIKDKIYAYTTGWTRRVSVDVDTGIGLVISSDNGETFQRIGAGPVLSASLYEPFLVCDGFVRFFENQYYMFYIFGTKWSEATEKHTHERVYKIAYATSEDGVSWKKAGRRIIEDVIDENECQALPTVIKINNRYHMYFCYRNMVDFRTIKGKGYRLGYAYSDNLIDWTRDDVNAGISLSDSGWDSSMMAYPNIFEMDGDIYLLYNGNDFGKNGFGLAVLEKGQLS